MATALAMPAVAAETQAFPGGKPIEMTVMFGAGSAADIAARQLAEGMAKVLAVPVVVVNRTGGGGAIGYMHVSQQKPDGHAIVWNSNSVSTTFHSGSMTINYQAFEPVARVSIETPVIAVKADSRFKTLKDLLAEAKEKPGTLRVGNSGAGSHTHFVVASLFGAAGGKVIDVPFNQGNAVTNLLGDRIEAVVQLPAAVVSHAKAGSVRVLASLGQQRDGVFPEVATAKEQGYGTALDLWRGIAVPKGTPKAVVAKLEAAIRKTTESAEFKDAGARIGFTPAYLPADKFGALVAKDDADLAKVMADLGLKK